ncbi:MAG: hypothetical protein U5K79_10875 [Cyclobacteriaceae bacterium]|nr:hypothetical protein [Cyclobacteriaceae bacterium]
MKRFNSTLALILVTFATAMAFNSTSESAVSQSRQAETEFTLMQKDAHLILAKYARMQERNTKYTFDILSSRFSFDYTVTLYNNSKPQESQKQMIEDLTKGRNE